MSAPSANSACFEDALEQLEDIVHRLEDGQIGLAEALAQYEQGVKLLRHCHQLLENAERKIEVLSRVTPEGDDVNQPWDDAATSLEEKTKVRSRRRSSKTAAGSPESTSAISGPSNSTPLDRADDDEEPEGRLF